MRDWGTYRKLYDNLPPDFERLPYASRCFSADILRRGDRNGRIIPGTEFNEKLVADLAFHVRAHTDESEFLRRALEVLLEDGYLVFRSGYLAIRNFVDAQRSEAADRMAKKRALDAGLPFGDVTEDECNSDEHDASDVTSEPPPRARVVSSRLVSSDSDQGSPNRSDPPSRPRSPAPDPAEHKPAQLAADWQPPPAQVKALAEKWEVPEARILCEVAEFRWYWTDGKGKGKRASPRGWAQSFGNRVNALAKDGALFVDRKAQPRPGGGARHVAPRQPDSGYRPSDHATEIT